MTLGFEGGSLGIEGTVGWTYGDGWATVGGGSITVEDVGPTHAHPSWTENISVTDFENIHISDIVYLCPTENSPNLGITGCTAYGDAGGGACWS